MMTRRVLGLAVTLLVSLSAALANVTMPNIFSDHMVLQQQKPIQIWGKADAQETVTVQFAKQTKTATADSNGNWHVTLKAMKAKAQQSGQTLTVTGKNTLTFKDILIGEVWVCSGQSNMEMGIGIAGNAKEEIANANYPNIRLFTVPKLVAVEPKTNVDSQWLICSPDTVSAGGWGGFSAAAFYFGRYLYKELNVPIGLIHTSWGGTVAEAWTSGPALRTKMPEFTAALNNLTDPNTSTKQAIALYEQKSAERKQAMEKLYALESDVTNAGKTAAPDFNDSAWKTMTLPGNWERNGLPDLDGIVWFRKTITVPATWAGKEIILRPGPIDEVDNTWFNGVLVGGKGSMRKADTTFWNVPREYHVPGNLVKAGTNVIAVRVFDALGEGGLWGAPAATMYAELADGSDTTHISLAGDWRYFVELTLPVVPKNPLNPNQPSVLYNAMINPLIPYGIRGAIWYQGEANAGRAKQYQTLLPTMITDWRTRWQEGDFPFLIVQLANFMARVDQPVQTGWAELREAQTMTAANLPKTGLALAIDIGEGADIHPKNKQEVGRRLGLAARSIAYGQKVAYSGPIFDKMVVKDGKAMLTFKFTNGGLVAKGDTLKGFAICGADKKFVWAQAKVEGNKVIVWADGRGNRPPANVYA
ncbi:MAG TPA: sialate O-acetylesterase, partial [Armatimonadota bacterium]|nr:sialate O-acetylesterase [Armatimonadota bacterium]